MQSSLPWEEAGLKSTPADGSVPAISWFSPLVFNRVRLPFSSQLWGLGPRSLEPHCYSRHCCHQFSKHWIYHKPQELPGAQKHHLPCSLSSCSADPITTVKTFPVGSDSATFTELETESNARRRQGAACPSAHCTNGQGSILAGVQKPRFVNLILGPTHLSLQKFFKCQSFAEIPEEQFALHMFWF